MNEDYNEEKVAYCKSCLSLRIVNLGDDDIVPYYCDDKGCGSTDIGYTDIHTWELLYEKRYNKKYITKK